MTPHAPVAASRPVELTRHGDVRVDPYYWLRERENPEVIAYLEAENAHTAGVLAPTQALQDEIFREIRTRVQETDVSPPARKGPWEYFSRTFEGSQYALHGRRPSGAPEGTEEAVLLDENVLADGLDYFSLGGLALSPDQHLIAYSFDDDGGELHTLRFRDVDSGTDLADTIDGIYYGLAWANDNRTIFYVRPDDAMRPYQVWRHTLGHADDVLVYEEADERFFVSVGRARSGGAIVLSSDSKVTSEARLLDPDDPSAPPRVVEPRADELEYDVEHHVAADGREQLFVLTNADGATNFKLVRAPVDAPGRASWIDVVPHRDDVKLDGVDVFRDFLVLSERAHGLEQLRVLGLADPSLDRVLTMDDPAYSTWIADNLEFDTPSFRLGYTSLVAPTERVRRDGGHRGAPAGEAHAGAGRLRPGRVHVGASVGDRARRHPGPDVGGAPQGHARRRLGAGPALRLRQLRVVGGPDVLDHPPLAARSRLRVRDRPHPRRR